MKNRIFQDSKIYLLCLMIILTGPVASLRAQTSFAILPIKDVDVTKQIAEEAISGLYAYLQKSGKYKIIDRESAEKVFSEQSLQTSTVLEPAVISKIGKILNVDKLLLSTIYKSRTNNFRITISVIDVLTSQIEFSKEIGQGIMTANNEAKLCVNEITAEYPIIGNIIGVVRNIIVINLGQKNALNIGDRIFIARKIPATDNSGKINFKRIGIAEIVNPHEGTSEATIKKLENSSNIVKNDDLVSPEPIPRQEPVISYPVPLLPDISKDEKIFIDDQNKNYLSVINSKNPSYAGGKLQLNATNLSEGQHNVYCFYPKHVLNPLDNFILESEFVFQKISNEWNKFSIYFRSNGDNSLVNSYVLSLNPKGFYEIRRLLDGVSSVIIPLQNLPAFNFGIEKNKFKIVADESKFDIYLNDKFLVGFEDENLSKGTIGFQVEKDGWVTIGDLKIWSIKNK